MTRLPQTPCLDEYDRVLAGIRREAKNAARRCKPTMWAYYERVGERLEAWFVESVEEARQEPTREVDGGIAGAALALVQKADALCAELPRDAAADLWAQSVYAARILRAWGIPVPRRSLKWLRQRAGVAA